MKKTFDIEHVGTPECDKRLDKELAPYQGNRTPIDNIKSVLFQPPLSVKTIVFESGYVDSDFQDEFAAFYSKSFKTYSKLCTRLHFFAAKIPKRTRVSFAKYSKAYCGYMVVRPTDLQRVGRTVIKPPFGDVNANTKFVHCHAEYTAHILGNPFTVDGMPFIQQDTQVGACAQACLWMVSRYMSRRYGHRHFLPAEINALAKAKLGGGRHLPAENGLTSEQMLEALQGMGLAAVEYRRHAMDAYSKHVESAFPIPPSPPNPTDADGDPMYTIQRNTQHAIAFAQNASGEVRTSLNTLNTNSNASGRGTPMIASTMQVRRLTPLECARLQGFPDNYLSQVTFRGKCPPSDGPMYKALGNSIAVNCLAWLGKRIQEMHTI